MKSNLLSSEEMSTLYNLRADTVNGYKMCFPNAYQNDKNCKLGCIEKDTIAQAYSCKIINIHDTSSSTEYLSVFSDILNQKQAVQVFMIRNNIRSVLLESGSAYQGNILGTSTPAAGGAREILGNKLLVTNIPVLSLVK
jgi:hypothetical protein